MPRRHIDKPTPEEVGTAVRSLLDMNPGFSMRQLFLRLRLPMNTQKFEQTDGSIKVYKLAPTIHRKFVISALKALPSESHENLFMELFHRKRAFHAENDHELEPMKNFFGLKEWRLLAEDFVRKNPGISRQELAKAFGVKSDRLSTTVFRGGYGSKVLRDWWARTTKPAIGIARERKQSERSMPKMERIRNRKFPGL